MSSTASITITQPSPIPCDSCITQTQALAAANARIEELEEQVRVLTLRATSAIEAANETELRRLNSTRSTAGRPSVESAGRPSSIQTTLVTPASPPRTAASRLARLLPSRTTSAPPTSYPYNAPAMTPMTSSLEPPLDLMSALNSPSPSELELIEALSHEQELRKAAESAAAKTNSEIEELTGQLFEQANEMVATERKARAKLEARVEVLEKRDGEKAKRLGLLEGRVQRVERIRTLLKDEGGI